MITIDMKSWNVRFTKPLFPNSHVFFYYCNYNQEKQKTPDNNTLHQERRIKFGKYQLTIQRTRQFKDVPDIEKFINRYDYRIGTWS